MVIQLLGFPTLCKVTHHTSQPRFACATFQDSPSASSRQHCYQCRPCLLVVFPLVRRQGFFQPIGAVSMPGTHRLSCCQIRQQLSILIAICSPFPLKQPSAFPACSGVCAKTPYSP